ncbi:MAG: phage portal protein [Acidobacteria bacterium]|nr:phage portal protein [Acidobacteriota bacterium]
MITLNLETPPMSQVVADRRKAEAARQKAAALQRTYQAAVSNRLTGDWTLFSTSTRSELRSQLRNLRARSRDLARNDPYMKKFLSMVRSNVVGPHGIRLQAKLADAVGALDNETTKHVEAKWKEWSHADTCSASGKLSFVDALKMFIATIARDGEVLCRMIVADNRFGFSLKFIDVNWLDEGYNVVNRDGTRIIMSVEVDRHDRPLAYWLTPPADEYTYGGNYDASIVQRTRVPAEEIIHCFVAEDDNQTRGVPWAHAVMLGTKILNGYREAELVAARVGACKSGFLIPPENDEYAGLQDENRQIIEDLQPGMLQELPPGYTFEGYDPTHPNANYGEFVKEILRSVAAGLDVSYFALANDLNAVNYSSARIGLLEERDIWRGLQGFVIEHFCRRVYLAWLRAGMLTGELALRPQDFERLREPMWQPRGWAWVDPMKDVQASVLAINNGLATRTDTLAEQGEDFEETVGKLASEQELLDAKAIRIVAGKPSAGTKAKAPDEAD